MDPDNPVRQVNDQSFTQVQRWVVSALAVTTLGHLVVGLIVGALFLSVDAPVSRVGICVIAGLFGVVAAGLARLIHQKRILSWWLLVGFIPGAVGVVLALEGVHF
jgi:hypothetical protein